MNKKHLSLITLAFTLCFSSSLTSFTSYKTDPVITNTEIKINMEDLVKPELNNIEFKDEHTITFEVAYNALCKIKEFRLIDASTNLCLTKIKGDKRKFSNLNVDLDAYYKIVTIYDAMIPFQPILNTSETTKAFHFNKEMLTKYEFLLNQDRNALIGYIGYRTKYNNFVTVKCPYYIEVYLADTNELIKHDNPIRMEDNSFFIEGLESDTNYRLEATIENDGVEHLVTTTFRTKGIYEPNVYPVVKEDNKFLQIEFKSEDPALRYHVEEFEAKYLVAGKKEYCQYELNDNIVTIRKSDKSALIEFRYYYSVFFNSTYSNATGYFINSSFIFDKGSETEDTSTINCINRGFDEQGNTLLEFKVDYDKNPIIKHMEFFDIVDKDVRVPLENINYIANKNLCTFAFDKELERQDFFATITYELDGKEYEKMTRIHTVSATKDNDLFDEENSSFVFKNGRLYYNLHFFNKRNTLLKKVIIKLYKGDNLVEYSCKTKPVLDMNGEYYVELDEDYRDYSLVIDYEIKYFDTFTAKESYKFDKPTSLEQNIFSKVKVIYDQISYDAIIYHFELVDDYVANKIISPIETYLSKNGKKVGTEEIYETNKFFYSGLEPETEYEIKYKIKFYGIETEEKTETFKTIKFIGFPDMYYNRYNNSTAAVATGDSNIFKINKVFLCTMDLDKNPDSLEVQICYNGPGQFTHYLIKGKVNVVLIHYVETYGLIPSKAKTCQHLEIYE